MADLVITAASVISSGRKETGTAGATVTAGQVVYLDSADNKFKLADNDSATAAVRAPHGIALNGAATGQPLTVHTGGSIVIGATVAVGTVYMLSSTAGGIAPVADLGAGDYNSTIGVATSTTAIDVDIQSAGAVTV